MRLLNVNSFKFTEFREGRQPKYVIASHRWVEGEEVTLLDVREEKNKRKSGYKKIKNFAKYVRQHVPDVEWLWIDTACIDKTNAAELSKSLNLMFEWYCNAVLCIAYLADVKSMEDKSEFQRSEWFKRGWTLQELLGPRLLIFVTDTWQVIGNKGASTYIDCGTASGPGVEEDIAAVTNIPERVLRNYAESANLSVEEKLKWMEGRATTEPEDMSYALFGILGVTPGANYGEKHEGARQRLMAAVHHQDNAASRDAERFQKIVKWLSPPDPWTNHQSARQLHEPGTGTWLLQSKTYQDWKASSTRHLWLYGKAGCGKTVLCSTAIKDLEDYCESQPEAEMAVFYFTFSDNRKQRLADMLCSLVVQLGWKGPALLMLQQAFDKPNRSPPGIEELEAILLACFDAYHEVFLFIDALDECPEENDSRHMLFECLLRLSQKPTVKILATSRELLDIRESIVRLGMVPMAVASRSINFDIQQYVETQLSQDPRLSRLDQKTRTEIGDTLCSKADGMQVTPILYVSLVSSNILLSHRFRWVYCQLQELKKLKATKPKFVKALLLNLPETLDDTYERMLSNIESLFRSEALTLLQWLAYAKSPPSLGELAEATIIDPTEGTVEENERGTIEDTLHILSGLITIVADEYISDEDDKSDAPISGPEFNIVDMKPEEKSYIDNALDGEDCNNNAALSELEVDIGNAPPEARSHIDDAPTEEDYISDAALTEEDYNSGAALTEEDSDTYSLTSIASFFPHSESGIDIRVLASECQMDDAPINRDTKVRLAHFSVKEYLESKRILQSRVPEFYLENVIGHRLLAQSCLIYLMHYSRSGNKTSTHDDLKNFPLLRYAAEFWFFHSSLQNCAEVSREVSLLTSKDAMHDWLLVCQPDHQSRLPFESPEAVDPGLYYASYIGLDSVVRQLLANGADSNARGYWGTALFTAAREGHKEIIQMLLDAGADVNARSALGTALMVASLGGNKDIVQILLDAGAYVNSAGEEGSALGCACAKGCMEVVQTLLNAGADVNAFWCYSPLRVAILHGYSKIARMLIHAGLNADLANYHSLTVLQSAAYRGQTKIVQILLDAGAHVDWKSRSGTTAVQMASAEGHDMVVQMLLDAGADVNLADAEGRTALQMASRKGYVKTVQKLLDAGADVNIRSGSGHCSRSALRRATRGGHEKIVQMLLDVGAEPIDTVSDTLSDTSSSNGGHCL